MRCAPNTPPVAVPCHAVRGILVPLIATALVGWASGSIWPVIVYVVVICLVGAIATAAASIRPDVEGAGRLHERTAH